MLAVVVLLGIGLVAARLPGLPAATPRALDWVVIWLSLPGLILARVPELSLDQAALVPVAVAWGIAAVLAVAVLALARVASWSSRTIGTLLLVVPLGNTSFLGIPAVQALLGSEHVPYAVIYDQLGSFLLLATYGSVIAARFGAGASPTAASVARRVVTFPPFVALVVAVALRPIGVPALVDEVATLLGATLTPLAMLTVGMRLRLPGRAALVPLASGLGLRLVVAPALVLAVATLVGGLSGDPVAVLAWQTSTLEAAMPPMVTASVVAIAVGLEERLAAALVGAGVLAAMVTLPAWASLLG